MDLSLLDQLFTKIGVADANVQGILKIFFVVLGTFIAAYIASRFINRLEQQVSKTKTHWDDSLIWAARKPVSLVIWLFGISLATAVADKVSGSGFYSFVEPVRRLGLIAAIAWFIWRFIVAAEQILVSPERMQKPMDPTTVSAMSKLLRGSVFVTAALVILQSMGYSISGVLAFGGIGGLAIGFAAKDLLANFFGGLMIYLDRPFKVGDWVRSPDKNIEGTVEQIGWRLTTIRTFDKRPLYVPNATFASISVENPSRMSHRRIYETIGLRYEDAQFMEPIVADVKDMLAKHDEIDETQTLIVNFVTFNSSSLDFFVYTFTKTTNWIKYHEVKQDVMLKILDIIARYGAEIAYPTQTLHHASLPAQAEMVVETLQ